jgi:cobalt-zinc-cadmium efflux system protein
MIVIVILLGTWGLLRDSINLSIDAVPQNVELPEIKSYLLGLESISDLHDLHIWALSTTEVALTVHLITTDTSINNTLLEEIQEHLHHHFNISHATIQIEYQDNDYLCMLNHEACKF